MRINLYRKKNFEHLESDLLEAILIHSSLVELQTSRGEHLLQFLAQTVARQVKEQTLGKETIESGRSRSKIDDQENCLTHRKFK